jgi:PAS domain S-box-containing protein
MGWSLGGAAIGALLCPTVLVVEIVAGTTVNIVPLMAGSALITLVVIAGLAVVGRQAAASNARVAEIASLVDSTEDAVIGTTLEGVITSWNRGAESTYGWTAFETIGQPLEMIVPPATRGAVATSMRKIALGATAIHHQASGFHRDGYEIDVALTVCPVFVGGRLVAVSTVARNISSSVKAERDRERLLAELAQQNDQLRELDVMKDEFVALVSHELRTPLTAIQGYNELVLDGTAGELNDEQRTMLKGVGRNSARLLRLINDLLFIAQVNAGKLTVAIEDVDLATILADATADARPRAEAAGVILDLSCDPTPTVRADGVRLAQVFDNLISNAIKFTPAGGRVGLSVSMVGEDVRIVVVDSGMGMTPEDQQRLFTRFFRTKAAAKIQGTGLGLAITKAILDAHNGSITVDSEPGHGTCFTVTIPSVESAVGKQQGWPVEAAAASG